MQPFLFVTLAHTNPPEQIIINEAHVVSVQQTTDGFAVVALSNGTTIVISQPPYEDWFNDVLIRKP
jgi:hypothetical protein